MKRIVLSLSIVFLHFVVLSQQRDMQPVNINIEGKQVKLYEQSHALIIGMSNYTNGWPSLPGVNKDIVSVKTALENCGFNVFIRENMSKEQMDKAFVGFIRKYGQEQNNRLLFYFAGHGHTITTSMGEVVGYLVPIDAPNPNFDQTGFVAKSMPMSRIEEHAKQIQSKHALFLFDACFSDPVFALSKAVPEEVNNKTIKPVRQFITSGSENETVPDKSIFRQQFVSALTTKYADSNNDGYLTGSELGIFLQDKVISYSKNSQHPKYAKIRNQNLDKGDFVFLIENSSSEKINTSDQPRESNFTQGKIVYEYGSISIDSKIGGSLYLDGDFKGTIKANSSDNRLNNILPGTHTLSIKGDENWEQEIIVYKDQTAIVKVEASDINQQSKSALPEVSEEEVFMIVEKMPLFPGGDLGLRKWIASQIRYPKEARVKGIEGKVYVRFKVNREGKVKDVQVARGVHPLLDNEAVRVLKLSPKWEPGEQKGKKVSVWYTVPINYGLN